MKKEIKELLEKKPGEKGTLQINELFRLKRWVLDPETDILGRDGEFLELEMTNDYGKTRSRSIEIKSRDADGIQKEVYAAMCQMMDEYRDRLAKSWQGGYIG